MTSTPCPGETRSAAPFTRKSSPNPLSSAGRNRGPRCPKRRSRRAADRANQPVFRRALPQHLFAVAQQKGFTLVGRGRRPADLKLRCGQCQQQLQVRRSVLLNNAPQCNHCLWRKRFDDAMAAGATIVAPHHSNHKIATLALSCGHSVERQYGRLSAAAKGGHSVGCAACREARYVAQAQGSGWTLIGPTSRNMSGYRQYRHHCGHCQDHAIVNIDNMQIDCAGCGETWASKPSHIYLFQIELTDRSVLKLGYSSNPTRRLRQQLGDAARKTGQILRVIDLETGHAALKAEKRAHHTLRKRHPELVINPSVFADQITTKSEIYAPSAKARILALMDQIVAAAKNGGDT